MHRHRQSHHEIGRQRGRESDLEQGFRRQGKGRGIAEGRGRQGRFFQQGDLRLVILKMTDEQPRYGYEIIKAIDEKLAGLYSPSPGSVYPTLTLLQEMGFVTVAPVDGKTLFAATDAGRAHLAENAETLASLTARMDAAGAGRPAPQIVRAVANLRMALRAKRSAAELGPEQIQALADELDAATRRIEQI